MGARPTFRDLDDLYAEIEAFGDAVDPRWVREFQLSTLARPVPAEWLDMVVEESLKVPARVWKALVEPTLRADHAGELGRISAPVLLAWGDQDGIARRADQDELLRLIPRCAAGRVRGRRPRVPLGGPGRVRARPFGVRGRGLAR